MKRYWGWAAVLVFLALPTGGAHADLIPTLVTVTGVGPFTFSYTVQLSAGQNVQPGGVPGITSNSGPGASGATTADYFTIYDFGGFVPGSNTQPSGWAFLTANL